MFKENRIENKIEGSKEEESQEEYTSKVSLEFFRHDEKSKAEPGQPDEEVKLTEKGRKHARSLSETKDISQAVAFGSQFRRARETAAQIMAGESRELTGNETLEEAKKIIDAELKYGTKVGTDPRLGFMIDTETQYGKDALAAFKKGEWMTFLTEKSDDLAKETADKNSSTYSRMAAGVAGIVDKYLTVAPRFDSLVEKKGYEKELKRFFGSHQGVLESFLGKLIEKTKGKEDLKKFVSAVKNQGFDYAEGFKMDIEMQNGEPRLKVFYKKNEENPFEFNEEIDPSIIKDIIKEGSEK